MEAVSLNWILELMEQYGTPAFTLILFLGALGLPVPGTLSVLVAGAMARLGVLDGTSAFLVGLAGVVLGDTLAFGVGRVARGRILRRFAHTTRWQQTAGAFDRQGGSLIYLSRWLVTPLALPVNLIAGSSGYSLAGFVRHDVLGEMTWLVVYGGMGYVAGSQWTVVAEYAETLGSYLSAYGLYAAAALVVGWGLYVATTRWESIPGLKILGAVFQSGNVVLQPATLRHAR
jgi:membrane-associated protein